MIRRLIIHFVIFCSAMVAAAPAEVAMPKPLLKQLERLTELLRDNSSCVRRYGPATMVQYVKPHDGMALVFVKFMISSFNCGNNDTEYFAAFNVDKNENGKPYFQLMDFLRTGGKGERRIHKLDAKVTWIPNSYNALIEIETFEMQSNDIPDDPSKKVTMKLQLKDWRLYEPMQP